MELNASLMLMSPVGKRIRFREANGLFFDIDYSQFVNSAYQRSGKLIMVYATHTFTLNMMKELPKVKAAIYNNMLCTESDIEAMRGNRIISVTVDGLVFRRLVEFSKAEMDTITVMLNNGYSQQNVIDYCGLCNFKVQSLNNPSNNGVVVNCVTTLDKKNIGHNLKYVTEMILRSINVGVGNMRIMSSNNNAYIVYLFLQRGIWR